MIYEWRRFNDNFFRVFCTASDELSIFTELPSSVSRGMRYKLLINYTEEKCKFDDIKDTIYVLTTYTLKVAQAR